MNVRNLLAKVARLSPTEVESADLTEHLVANPYNFLRPIVRGFRTGTTDPIRTDLWLTVVPLCFIRVHY